MPFFLSILRQQSLIEDTMLHLSRLVFCEQKPTAAAVLPTLPALILQERIDCLLCLGA